MNYKVNLDSAPLYRPVRESYWQIGCSDGYNRMPLYSGIKNQGTTNLNFFENSGYRNGYRYGSRKRYFDEIKENSDA